MARSLPVSTGATRSRDRDVAKPASRRHQRRFVEKRSQRIRHLARRVEKAYPKTFQILTPEVGRHVDDPQPLAVASNLPPAGCYGASSETARTSSTDRRTRQTDRQRSFEFLEQHFERNFEWLYGDTNTKATPRSKTRHKKFFDISSACDSKFSLKRLSSRHCEANIYVDLASHLKFLPIISKVRDM